MKKTIFGIVVALLGILIGAGGQFYYGLIKPPAAPTAGGPPGVGGAGGAGGGAPGGAQQGAPKKDGEAAKPSAGAGDAAKPAGSGAPSGDASKSAAASAGAPGSGAGSGAAGAGKGGGGGGSGGGGGGGSPVEIAVPEVLTWPKTVSAVGTLRSDESVSVRSEVSGRITDINFKEGQRVAKGQMLVKLDDTVIKAELEQARANQRLAKAKFDRAVELKERNFISGQAKDEAENAMRVADASVQLVDARLARLAIYAPFNGTTGLRQVGVGDYLREGQDVVNVEKTDLIKVDFKVPELFLNAAKPGQKLQMTMDAMPKQAFTGTLVTVSPQLDSAGRAVVLRAQLPNAKNELKSGMFARVRLVLDENADTITIPEQALAPQGDEQFVFKVVEGRAARTKIETGQRRDGRVEVVNGLAKEDRVVAAGWQRLRDGMPVRPVGGGGPPGGGGGAGKGGDGAKGDGAAKGDAQKGDGAMKGDAPKGDGAPKVGKPRGEGKEGMMKPAPQGEGGKK